ncbi:cytochrome c [Acidimicrobiia bacterium EGI L10123]|uniref:c-type cytochrome n=1 Tax=Salinilacustrithrix flava TaxID=2957203 RepID=UPI003D7C266C|nr:cytochrome c [Acidimicrobiia bacterium EGI L10123]
MTAARNRTTSWAIPVVVVALAAVVAVVLVVSGGSSEEPPAPGSPEELALGEEVFEQSCATCHGEGLRGGLAGPPLLHEIYAPDHHPDSAIRAAVAQGVQPHHWDFAAMPPIPDLSEADVDAVIAYIRDTQRQAWGGDTP